LKRVKQIRNRYRYSIILLKQLVKTDFKLRYQGSFLGYIWSLLRPLALFVILYAVFTKIIKVGGSIPHYPVYLLLGIVLWNYFAEVTSGSVGAIVGRGDLLRKLSFPRYVIVLAGSFSALINLFLNLVIVAIFMVITHVELRPIAITFPIFIVELFVFSLALGFFLSAAYVRFRDINYIWEVIMQAAFYATPILYPLSLVPTRYAKILILNPMAQIIQDSRYVIVTPKTQTISSVYNTHWIRVVPIGITVVLVIVAATYFRKRSRYFAEEV
jgi:ABC-2 type transport system permease protein